MIEDSDLNIDNWVRVQSWDILASDAFCPCPETLPKAGCTKSNWTDFVGRASIMPSLWIGCY